MRDTEWRMPSDLNDTQTRLFLEKSPPPGARLRKYSVISVLNAIFYLIKTGWQWRQLPMHYPKWRTVYNHFRSWSDRGWFQTVLLRLVFMRRKSIGRNGRPSIGQLQLRAVSPYRRTDDHGRLHDVHAPLFLTPGLTFRHSTYRPPL